MPKKQFEKSGKYYGFRVCCMRLTSNPKTFGATLFSGLPFFLGYPSFGATLLWGYQYGVTLIVFRVPLKFLCVYCKDYF